MHDQLTIYGHQKGGIEVDYCYLMLAYFFPKPLTKKALSYIQKYNYGIQEHRHINISYDSISAIDMVHR